MEINPGGNYSSICCIGNTAYIANNGNLYICSLTASQPEVLKIPFVNEGLSGVTLTPAGNKKEIYIIDESVFNRDDATMVFDIKSKKFIDSKFFFTVDDDEEALTTTINTYDEQMIIGVQNLKNTPITYYVYFIDIATNKILHKVQIPICPLTMLFNGDGFLYIAGKNTMGKSELLGLELSNTPPLLNL